MRDGPLRTPSMEMPPAMFERCQTIGKRKWDATSRFLNPPSAGPGYLFIEHESNDARAGGTATVVAPGTD